MARKKPPADAPDFVPTDMQDQGTANVPEVWANAPDELAEQRKAQWAELQRLPGIGQMLTYARSDIDNRIAKGGIDWAEEELLRALNADTAEGILADDQAIGAEVYLNRPFKLSRFEFHDTSLADGFPVFMVLQGTDIQSGKPVVITTSGSAIMARVFALHLKNLLPQDCVLTQTEETRRGFKALKISAWRPDPRF